MQADGTVSYHHFGTFDGLPGENITALVQSPNGLLWVGTESGLAVYDGREFRQISFPDSLGTPYIHSLSIASDGSVWVSPALGVVAKVSYRGLERLFSLEERANIRQILLREDTVTFLAKWDYWTLDPGEKEPTRHSYQYESHPIAEMDEHPEAGVGVFNAARDSNGHIWILDGRLGPGRLHSDGTITFVDAPSGTPGDLWYEIGFSQKGIGFLTKGEQLLRFAPDEQEFETVQTGLGDPTYLSVEDNVVYATQDRDILRYEVGEGFFPSPLGPNMGLPETTPRQVLRGREGALWIGTRDGLIQVLNPEVRLLEAIEGTSLYNVAQFMPHEQALWGRTNGSGLFQLRPERRQETPDGIVGWEQKVYSHDEFLHAISSNTRTWKRWSPSDGWHTVRNVAPAFRGVVGPDGNGFFRRPDGLYRYSPEPEAAPAQILSWSEEESRHFRVAPASEGELLVQDHHRLLRLRPPSGEVVDTVGVFPDSLHAHIQALSMGPDGRVWAANERGGVLRLDSSPESVQRFLEHTPMWNVRTAGDSLVLATTRERGLYLVETETGKVRQHLTQTDGLQSNEVLDAHLTADTLYLAHSRGVTLFPTSRLFTDRSSPSVLMSSWEVDLHARSLHSGTRLDVDERTVGFSFTAPSLTYADRVGYEVRLVPLNTTWQSLARGFTRYRNLEPGTYRFEVRARMADQPPGPVATHSFTIPPRFYETWWFYVVVVLGTIGGVAAAYRWRTYHLLQRQEELEQAVDHRMQELRARTEELAEEKRKTERQAERLAELDEAKNRFFAHISHEFRTPLSLILSPLQEAVRRGKALSAEQKWRMTKSAERLQRLIEQLLDLATLEAGRMSLDRQPGDLTVVLKRMTEVFRSEAEEKDIDLSIDVPSGRIETRFDLEKIETIVSNLVGNALKFTPAGGAVTVCVEETEDVDSRVHPRTEDEVKGVVRIEVQDSGPGIDPEVQEQIFNRFERADTSATRKHEGMGLGLALTKELVELQGGTIELENTPGEGTTFRVHLPLVPLETEASTETLEEHQDGLPAGGDGTAAAEDVSLLDLPEEERASRTASSGKDANASILVVEDNDEMRAYLREQLSDRWHVFEAAEGEEGWKKVQEERPDLVLSDVMMPGVDGLELCRRIKAEEDLRTIPVLLLTARAGDTAAVEGLECGADDYVTKPFDIEELRQRITNFMAARVHLREQYRREVRLSSLGATAEKEQMPFIEEVIEVVDEHLGNPDFTVGRLAEEMALSRRQLTRRLKEALDRTPGALIRQRRIDQAKAHLERGAETVAEVAYAVGFRSPSAFSQAFQKQEGCAPSTYASQQIE